MKVENDIQKWQEEFEEFCKADGATPPVHIAEQIKPRIRRALVLASWVVFAKLCLVTLVGGGATLLVCPQFAMGHGGHMTAIGRLYHSLGPTGCTLACGATFIGLSLLLATLVLRSDEVGLIRRKAFVQVPAVAMLFLGFFVCAGAEVFLEMALLWWSGGVIAGLAALEVGWQVRRYAASVNFA